MENDRKTWWNEVINKAEDKRENSANYENEEMHKENR